MSRKERRLHMNSEKLNTESSAQGLESIETPEMPVTDAVVEAVEQAETVSEVAAAMSEGAVDGGEQVPEAVVEVVPEATPASVLLSLLAKVQELEARLSAKKRVKSGSKPRPNVHYKLLDAAPAFHKTPQVAALQNILYAQPKRLLSEPEAFDLILAGAAAGVLRTTQEPVRIFQYYRDALVANKAMEVLPN